ncbi:carboxylesterase family protein [Paenibacillus sp. CN-4]|uniref:carboxylesterase family protein n=1 Tax=Paenibacillus nanchangensis TaxID=3348343 RepID=UPI00397CFC9D
MLPFNPDLPYDQKGAAPLQPGDNSWLEADNGLSENCLNLNVWAPEDAGDEPLPVIVYIYGGGFERGANTRLPRTPQVSPQPAAPLVCP